MPKFILLLLALASVSPAGHAAKPNLRAYFGHYVASVSGQRSFIQQDLSRTTPISHELFNGYVSPRGRHQPGSGRVGVTGTLHSYDGRREYPLAPRAAPSGAGCCG